MTDPVAVVGLGPVGSVLALLLARSGVPTVAVEREVDVFPLSRAIALDDEALRVLQGTGLNAARAPAFLTEQTVRFRSRDGAPLVDLPPRLSSNGHPALAFFHQPDLERALRDELHRHPLVTLLLGHELEGFDDRGDGVVLTLRDHRDGARSTLGASELLACDGARSFVRRELGIRLRGMTSPRRWLVVDTERATGRDAAPFEFICDPARPTVAAPLPGGRQRWEFMLLPGEDAGEMEQPEAVRRLLAPLADAQDVEVIRATVYTFHARIAERWRDGRVFLVGDAAHLSPPFAGQGLSAGLRDAHNLAWKIAAVREPSADRTVLGTYEAERRPHAAQLVTLAVLLGLVVQTRRPAVASARDASLRTLLRLPGVRSWAAGGGWKPASSYRRGFVGERRSGLEGSQLPQPDVLATSSGERPLDDVLGPGFALVAFETDPAAGLDRGSRAALDALRARLVHVSSRSAGRAIALTAGVGSVRDETGVLREWFARAGAPVALVRPDRHVYAVLRPGETASAVQDLASALHGRSRASS